MNAKPCTELRQVFQDAYPCQHLRGACTGMCYKPELGHLPRGYTGALGKLREVELVLILAEPGNPPPGQEVYPAKADTPSRIVEVASGVAVALADESSSFHKNLRIILNACWPSASLKDQLRKTWITESVLCSARKSTGHIPRPSELACTDSYLRKQLALLPGRYIVTLGRKAAQRVYLLGIRPDFEAAAPGRPGGNTQKARNSWKSLGKAFTRHLR